CFSARRGSVFKSHGQRRQPLVHIPTTAAQSQRECVTLTQSWFTPRCVSRSCSVLSCFINITHALLLCIRTLSFSLSLFLSLSLSLPHHTHTHTHAHTHKHSQTLSHERETERGW